jgi:hypothetical protein
MAGRLRSAEPSFDICSLLKIATLEPYRCTPRRLTGLARMPAGVRHCIRIHVAQSEDVAMKTSDPLSPKPFDLDLDNLLHPARAFEHPQRVVDDPDLTINEKRAILASWASDACAVEAVPALRCAPGSSRPVSIDEILDALRTLDKAAHGSPTRPPWRRRGFRQRGTPGDAGPGLSP